MKCCNDDCAQGRDCPHETRPMSNADVVFTVVMTIIAVIVTVPIMWSLITAVMIIVEALK